MAADGVVSVHIPAVLVDATGGKRIVDVDATTVREALAAIEQRHAGFADRVLDASGLRRGLVVYVDGSNVRFGAGLDTPVTAAQDIRVLPAAGITPRPTA